MHERARNCMLNAWNMKWAGPGTWIDCIPNRTHIDTKGSRLLAKLPARQ